jgi:hypothetical protein
LIWQKNADSKFMIPNLVMRGDSADADNAGVGEDRVIMPFLMA